MSEASDLPADDGEFQREQLVTDLRDAIDIGNGEWVRQTLEDMHPADASDLLEQLSTGTI